MNLAFKELEPIDLNESQRITILESEIKNLYDLIRELKRSIVDMAYSGIGHD